MNEDPKSKRATLTSHEARSWLTYATAYRADVAGGQWTLVTAMPEAFYLAGARTGSSRSAMVFALSLVVSLVLAAVLGLVTVPVKWGGEAVIWEGEPVTWIDVAWKPFEQLPRTLNFIEQHPRGRA